MLLVGEAEKINQVLCMMQMKLPCSPHTCLLFLHAMPEFKDGPILRLVEWRMRQVHASGTLGQIADRNCLRVEVPLHMRCHLVKKGGSISDFDGGRSLGTETGARAFSARR